MISCYAGQVAVGLRDLHLEVVSGVRDSDRIGWLRYAHVNEYNVHTVGLRLFSGEYSREEDAVLLRKFENMTVNHHLKAEQNFSPPGVMWSHLLDQALPSWNTSKISREQQSVEQQFFRTFFSSLKRAQKAVVIFKRMVDLESSGYMIVVEGEATPLPVNAQQQNLIEVMGRIHHKVSHIFRTGQSNTFGATYFVTDKTSDYFQQVKETHCQYHVLQRSVDEPQSLDLSQHISKDHRLLEGMNITDSHFPNLGLIEEMPSHWSLMQISLWPLSPNAEVVSQVFNVRVVQRNVLVSDFLRGHLA